MAAVMELELTATKTSLEWLVVRELTTDPEYDRPLSSERAAKIARNFDPDAVGTLLVSRRPDGSLVMLDGQHRTAAFWLMGWQDQRVPCLVYEGLSQQDEARIFRKINDERRKPTPVDLYHSRLVEGDPVARGIQEVLDRLNLRVVGTKATGHIRSVRSLEMLYTNCGPEHLEATLRVIMDAWGVNYQSLNQDLILGVGLFLHRYSVRVDEERLRAKLAAYKPAEIVSRARLLREHTGHATHGMGTVAVPTLLTSIYNSHLQRKLPAWEARGAKAVWRALPPEAFLGED